MTAVTSIEISPDNLPAVFRDALGPMGVTDFQFFAPEEAAALLRSFAFPSGEMSLVGYRSSGHRFRLPGFPFFTIDVPLAGYVEKSVGEAAIRIAENEVSICRPGDLNVIVAGDGGVPCQGISCFLTEAGIAGILRAHNLRLSMGGSVQFRTDAEDALASCARILQYAFHEFYLKPTARTSLRRVRLAEALLHDHIAEVFAATGLAEPVGKVDVHDQAVMARFAAIVSARFHEPLSVVEIAEEFAVGVRRLRRACRAATGETPSQYLSRCRLEAAHARLLRAGETDTVTSIAADCGIAHLGRFAERYRRRYGETPQQSLRSGRANS